MRTVPIIAVAFGLAISPLVNAQTKSTTDKNKETTIQKVERESDKLREKVKHAIHKNDKKSDAAHKVSNRDTGGTIGRTNESGCMKLSDLKNRQQCQEQVSKG